MSPLHSLTHDGPPPLAVRGFVAPRCGPWAAAHAFGGGSSTSQAQSTSTTDNRVGVDGDGNQIYHGNEIGGSLVFNSLADDVALGALDTGRDITQIGADTTVSLAAGALAALERLVASNEAVTNQALGGAQKIAGDGLTTASDALAEASARAAQVADSQTKFLAVQTGQETVQKTILYGIAGAAVIGLGLAAVALTKAKK